MTLRCPTPAAQPSTCPPSRGLRLAGLLAALLLAAGGTVRAAAPAPAATTPATTAAVPAASPSPAETVGRLGFFLGEVRCRAGAGPWSPARLDQPLTTSHELRTGPESRAEVQLGSSVVRMGESSLLRLAGVKVKGRAASGLLDLLFGNLWSSLRGLGEGGLELRSPTAVMAVRGTVFRADAGADSSLAVWVYEGRVDTNRAAPLAGGEDRAAAAAAPGAPQPLPAGAPRPVPGPYEITLDEWVRVTQGMRLSLRPDGRYALERFDQERDRQDDWVRWNLERDAAR